MKIKIVLVGYVEEHLLQNMSQQEIQDTINAIYEGDILPYDLVDEYKVQSVGLEDTP